MRSQGLLPAFEEHAPDLGAHLLKTVKRQGGEPDDIQRKLETDPNSLAPHEWLQLTMQLPAGDRYMYAMRRVCMPDKPMSKLHDLLHRPDHARRLLGTLGEFSALLAGANPAPGKRAIASLPPEENARRNLSVAGLRLAGFLKQADHRTDALVATLQRVADLEGARFGAARPTAETSLPLATTIFRARLSQLMNIFVQPASLREAGLPSSSMHHLLSRHQEEKPFSPVTVNNALQFLPLAQGADLSRDYLGLESDANFRRIIQTINVRDMKREIGLIPCESEFDKGKPIGELPQPFTRAVTDFQQAVLKDDEDTIERAFLLLKGMFAVQDVGTQDDMLLYLSRNVTKFDFLVAGRNGERKPGDLRKVQMNGVRSYTDLLWRALDLDTFDSIEPGDIHDAHSAVRKALKKVIGHHHEGQIPPPETILEHLAEARRLRQKYDPSIIASPRIHWGTHRHKIRK